MVLITREHLARLAEEYPRWDAVLTILSAPVFRDDPRVWAYVLHEDIDFTSMMRQRTFGAEERYLLDVAASLFGTGREVDLNVVFMVLRAEWAQVAALAVTRRARERAI